ncbi:YbfB/YjiJ family MFS transporter [Vibrio sp. S4M6]|uniref:YbfB/YjiJ family MFS transporter n=1 Tax=Vibrio sinus TaxID=2946865 RepID=UPI00202A8C0C|nr:YbfB/YjiJ family MFS transporter [Vibrio sinus]MCL9781747.1 YbfB/YjiJ family MFS transporter [Vibrio sinus]
MSFDFDKAKVFVAGIASLVLSVGIARFAYTPMLPIMQTQAGLSQSAGAWLASINYIGYFLGVVLTASIHDIRLKDTCYRLGMVIAVLSTMLMASTSNIWLWGLLRFFAGISSSAGILMSSGLVLNWLINNNKASKLGWHFSGIGLGIMLAAIVATFVHQSIDWREMWLVYGITCALLLYPALMWLPKPTRQHSHKTTKEALGKTPSPLFLRMLRLGYFCAGVGFVVNATFIVAIVNHTLGNDSQGYLIFILLGAAAAPSPIIWDKISHRMGHLNALLLACLIQTMGILLVAFDSSLTTLLISAILFGNTFIAIVNIVMTMSGQYYPKNPAKMMAKVALSYSFAQVVAPIAVAVMASHGLGYTQGLYLAGIVMVIGTLCVFCLKQLEQNKGNIEVRTQQVENL